MPLWLPDSLTYLKLPKVIPFRFVESEGEFFQNSIAEIERQTTYCQKLQQSDTIAFQVQVKKTELIPIVYPITSNYGANLLDEYGNLVFALNKYELITDSETGFTYVHFHKVLSYTGYTLPEGRYFIQLLFWLANNTIEYYYSEPIDVATEHKNTIYLQYRHIEADYDVYHKQANFIGGFNPVIQPLPIMNFRVEGGVWSKDELPSADSEVYYSQTKSAKIVQATPFNVYKITFGDNTGIPNYIADKLNRIFCCEFVRINMDYYTKKDGSELEQKSYIEKQVKGVWALDCVKYDNEYSNNKLKVKVPTGIGSGNYIIGNGFVVH